MSVHRRAFVAAWVVLLVPQILGAQQTVVAGSVRTQTGEPVRGAFVSVPAMNLGTITNDAGYYRLVIPDPPASGQVTLQAQNIGYREMSLTVTLAAGAVTTQNITLVEEAIPLEEVVVTGTAGRLERRAQAAVVAKVDAARVAQIAPVNNVQTLLQARVPGVHIATGSGSAGTAARIRIRGEASISLSNEPLVFIDGIRADSRQAQIYGVSGQSVSRLNDIAPEDIESIEVVKGPAAATLYGADASAGVINIITKRGRATGGITQSFAAEYTNITTNFDSPANWAACTSGDVADPARTLCQGQQAGAIISDNPLDRLNAFKAGRGVNLAWSLRGGGDNWGVFLSATGDQENGTLPSNSFRRLTWRSNFDFIANDKLRFEGGVGLSEANARLPYSDNSVFGFVAAGFLGSPRTVGTSADGLYSGAGVGGVEGRSAIENEDRVLRVQPRVAISYNPGSRFTNRVTLGADFTRTRAWTFFPKNDLNWYTGSLNPGRIQEAREFADRYTLDYLGNYTFDVSSSVRTDLSWGFQTLINNTSTLLATGTGLVANAARSVGAASERTGDENIAEDRQNGVLGQLQVSHRDRLYMQVAGRLDRASAFGAESKYFFSPRVGASYVISDEDFWQNSLGSFIPTMRLRAAYGTTGRSPTAGANATYNPSPFVLYTDNSVQPGVTPQDPGNSQLKPERGTELEVGFEAGMLNDRLSIDATWFDKTTTDAILRRPIAPSLGFGINPYVNIGEIVNRGIELGVTARVLTLPNLGWETRFTFNTLHNEVISLGDIEPFGTLVRTTEGTPVNAFYTYKVRSVDVANNVAIVSDTLEFVGNVLPGWEGSAVSTLNFLGGFTFYGQLDFRGDIYRRNFTDDFRDRQFRNSELWIRREELLTPEERIARFGPFMTETTDEVISFDNVNEYYLEKAHYVKLRELSLSYRVPPSFAHRFLRASEANISVAARNVKTWTPYNGLDPETTFSESTEFFTVPADRRWVFRINARY